MARGKSVLGFFWWNLNSFAHYDPSRAGEVQWPSVPDAYATKCGLVDRALAVLFAESPPDLLAFAEVTCKAVLGLRDRIFPGYEVYSLDDLPRPELQVAFLYRKSPRFEEQPKVVVPRLPRGTRAMAALDFCPPGHRIRFYACHWTARFGDDSTHHRSDLAHYLNGEIYRFLREPSDAEEVRHVVVLGDLNEEPYGLPEQRLHASRDRARARRRDHYQDRSMERAHLYNCSWRLLGERLPHSGPASPRDAAGTYYWQRKRTWHTFDHVIVSGGLLTDSPPYLDEAGVEVVAGPAVWGTDGKPLKFEWNNGRPRGLSDHLPIRGRIIL